MALRWEDVDFEQSSIRVFEGYSAKRSGKPKSRKSRTVPMVEEIARTLCDLKARGAHTAKNDLVFVSREGTHVDGSALRRRYLATLKAAGLRQLRFHDLRHTFGSLAINVASIVQVQAWMGHADIKTTMRYLHHKSRADDAQLLSAAFHPKKHPPAATNATAAKNSPQTRRRGGPDIFFCSRNSATNRHRSRQTGRAVDQIMLTATVAIAWSLVQLT